MNIKLIKTNEAVSLCGKCTDSGNVVCFSIDGGLNYYCVRCLHMWYDIHPEQKNPVSVDIRMIEETLEDGDVDWNGLSGLQAIEMKSGSHYQRIIDADLSYPIHISESMDILDGCHRFAKNKFIAGNSTINAIIVPDHVLDNIYRFKIETGARRYSLQVVKRAKNCKLTTKRSHSI